MNDDVVTVLDQNILLQMLPVGDLFVVELEYLATPKNLDVLGVGELLKAPGVAQSFENRGRGDQRKGARLSHLAIDIVLLAEHLLDEDVDVRVVQELREQGGEILGQFGRGEARGLDIVRKRRCDLTIRANRRHISEIVLPPSLDEQ